ncbi:MAG: glycosyltransferase [Tannerellaceae bacterium]|jgi:glycosyltransferase|nr:glycosyltransferase [Tannerellaceae bacterium]
MKQLIIFDEASRSAIYGIGTYIREIVHSLCDHYQIIVIIYYSKKKEFIITDKKTHKEISIPCNQLKFIEGKNDIRYFLNSLYLIYDYINPKNEVVFLLNHFRRNSFIELLKEYWPQSKVLLTVHYMYWCFLIEGNASYFKEIISQNKKNRNIQIEIERDVLIEYHIEKECLEKVDHIISLSEYTRNILIDSYDIPQDKITLIYNGLEDNACILSQREKLFLKKQLQILDCSKIVLFVGRIDKIKGIEELIRAFKMLMRENCYLFIIGDGELLNNCLSECEGYRNRIIFTGYLPKNIIYKYYQIADVGVLLSKHEQCSYVAIEMMMHGIPIIASDTTGLDEMIKDEVNGYKIKTVENREIVSFDIDNCSSLLSSALDTDNSRLRIEARNKYEREYTSHKMKTELLYVLNEIYK